MFSWFLDCKNGVRLCSIKIMNTTKDLPKRFLGVLFIGWFLAIACTYEWLPSDFLTGFGVISIVNGIALICISEIKKP